LIADGGRGGGGGPAHSGSFKSANVPSRRRTRASLLLNLPSQKIKIKKKINANVGTIKRTTLYTTQINK
jgi:hypothetical protein